MADKTEKIFAEGLWFKLPRTQAPAFVYGSLSVKVEEFKAFLDTHVNNAGYVNIDLLIPKSGGNPYCALNTYKPEAPEVVSEPEAEEASEDIDASSIPF